MRQNLPVENQFKRHNGELRALCLNELLTSMSIVVLICIYIFLIPIHSNITKRSGYVQECGLEFTQNSQSERSAYLPNGIPEHIYSFPEQYELKDCGKQIHYTSKNCPLFGNRYPSTQM